MPASNTAMVYNAFMSYSHAADARFAPFLQRAIQNFAKPWYKLRSVRIFRDETGLTLTPELWPDIQRAMNMCQFFILLASPEAADSEWVSKEIEHWRSLKRSAPLIVVTGGKVEWNEDCADFNWQETNAVPRALAGAYEQEPLYLDATVIRATELSDRNPKVRSAAAQIYARLANRSLDDVIGADLKQHKRNQLTAGAVVVTLSTLGVMYLLQRAETRRQETIAQTRRKLDVAKSLALESLSSNGGPDAVNIRENDAGRAAMLAVESISLMQTLEGNDALQAHMALTPDREGGRALPSVTRAVALSRNGDLVAACFGDGEISILPANGAGTGTPIQTAIKPTQMELSDNGLLWGFSPGRLAQLRTGTAWETHIADLGGLEISSDGRYYATAVKAKEDAEANVALFQIGQSEPVKRWTVGHPMSQPLAFSRNGKFLAFIDGPKVAVADIATGAVRNTIDTQLVEITALAVDDTGDAVVVFGWEPDPRYIIQKNFVVRSFPTTGTSTFRPIYYRGESSLGIGKLALDMKSGLIAVGGGPLGWIKVFDFFTTETVAVVRQDDMMDWTMVAVGETAEVVTASPTRIERHIIRRQPAEAAAAQVIIDAKMAPLAALNRNGSRVAVSAMRHDQTPFLSVIDFASGKRVLDKNLPWPAERLLLSPAGDYVAVWKNKSSAEIISINSGEIVWAVPEDTNDDASQPLYIAFSSDNNHLAWGRSGEGVFVEDLIEHQRRFASGPVSGLLAVSVSPAGRMVAWSFAETKFTASGRSISEVVALRRMPGGIAENLFSLTSQRIEGPAKATLAFDLSGEQLAAGVSHGLLKICDLRHRRLVMSFFNEGALDSIEFNDDGRYLLTTGTGRLVNSLEQPEAAVWSVAAGRKLWRRLMSNEIDGLAMTPGGGPVAVAQTTSLRQTGNLGIVVDRLYWQASDLVRIACEKISYRPMPEELDDIAPDLSDDPCGATH